MIRYFAIATFCLSCFFLSPRCVQAQDLFETLGELVAAPLSIVEDSSDDSDSDILGGAFDWTQSVIDGAADLGSQGFDLFWEYHYAPVLARELGLLE